MNEIHDQVHAFADGELEPAQADAFRQHLGVCEQCQAELGDILQLQAMGERLGAQPAVAPVEQPKARAFRPAWRRRQTLLAVGLGGALAAVMALVVMSGPRLKEEPVALALAPTRSMEARLSWQGASGWRPYGVKRSGEERPREQLSLKVLAALEEARDWHGLAVAQLLAGEPGRAAEALKQAGRSPGEDSDRAALALSRGALEEALVLLEGVLERAPRHPAALWNRALVLRELGLDLLSAEGFRQVEALGEPGWSEEGRQRAEAVERSTQQRQQRWKAAWEACKALAAQGTSLPEGTVREAPGLVRKYLYLSAWSAPTAERVRALLPVARELDSTYGGQVLEHYVERTARRDFRTRGPLATTFSQVLAGKALEPAAAERFLRGLEAAGELDILLGALPLLNRLPAQLDVYAAAARSVGDPWFDSSTELQRAQAQVAASRLAQAEQILLEALPACERLRLGSRCGELEGLLTYIYRVQHRLVEAREHALRGLERARRLNDADQETRFIQDLGSIEYFRDASALARAWLQESALRQPDYCRTQVYVAETLAQLRLAEMRPAQARAELERVPSCGAPRSMLSVYTLMELARREPRPGDVEKAERWLAELRAQPGQRPGQRLVADHVEGRLRLLQDRAHGQRLLREVVAAAGRLPREDTTALKARADSYSALILDAGQAGGYAEALALFAEEAQGPAPEHCTLGVELSEGRTLVVARGADGQPVGAYEASRRASELDVGRLVPEPVLAALRPCASVSVYARYPLHGREGLLPADFAWSYRRGLLHAAPPPTGTPRSLVVSDVAAPAALALPRLAAWTMAQQTPGRVDLIGAEATPSRVLAEMARSDEIDLHAHGLVNLGLSDASLVVLAPEADGHYALTAGDVRRHRLERAPVVLLASCRAARTAPYYHEPWSLPVAFLEAGARAVIASPADIPDDEAGPFFDAVRARIRAGESPAVAVRNERLRLLSSDPQSWARTVVIFEQ
ncbi:CHAT domain-containing protein [Archangium violaceum]|uniref:CHAT domain-containing protein n=1 Tax=Archangium violaceum TaxID=83451 RepID=UPI002B2F805C|nr:CHAT domain-containing protein [Archangium gephyra]